VVKIQGKKNRPLSLLCKVEKTIIKTKQKSESIEAYNVKEENSKSVQPIKAKTRKTGRNYHKRMSNMKNTDDLISELPENINRSSKRVSRVQVRHYTVGGTPKVGYNACIVIKIKSPKLYRHLRNRNLRPLPSSSTLSIHQQHR
jgi:hypothetical protein